jgi:hypothetical protein
MTKFLQSTQSLSWPKSVLVTEAPESLAEYLWVRRRRLLQAGILPPHVVIFIFLFYLHDYDAIFLLCSLGGQTRSFP